MFVVAAGKERGVGDGGNGGLRVRKLPVNLRLSLPYGMVGIALGRPVPLFVPVVLGAYLPENAVAHVLRADPSTLPHLAVVVGPAASLFPSHRLPALCYGFPASPLQSDPFRPTWAKPRWLLSLRLMSVRFATRWTSIMMSLTWCSNCRTVTACQPCSSQKL